MRTLVVDDDPVCRAVLQHALEPFGEVAQAEDGLAALAQVARALANAQPFDLVTLDIMMPELDGQQTLKAIRRLEDLFACQGRMRIAMASALEDKKNVFASFREQADLYFIKPLKLDRLLGDLRKAEMIPA